MSSNFDPTSIREDFPIFSVHPDLVYLDNAATSQTPKHVTNAVLKYYETFNANVHRTIYSIGNKATQAFEHARENVADFINSKEHRSIVFTKSATEAINLVANAWGRKNLANGDEILITEMEHHSNIVPWQLIAKETDANLKYIPITKNGELENWESCISDKTKIVAITHQSNVFGTINPIEKIVEKAHSFGAVVLVDAAQSVPHSKVDVQKLGCDFLVFSGHKMLGPTGVGVLYGKPDLLEGMDPFLGGGEMIKTVSMESSTWNDIPHKFEAGTPNIAQTIGLGTAIDYLNEIGMGTIHDYEQELLIYTLSIFENNPAITVYGKSKKRAGALSFNLENIHPHDVAQFLDNDGIAIRAGHHCAQPIMKKIGVSATCRASFYMYTTKEDIHQLAESLEKIESIFA
ncbi:MAG: cysteine desulfurase [Candidatus Marinimicrobia bacterium]|jgi:cysteine desulfurase/selenocysteine lyase|nr:cysteine desulfurase [Candidatus Neomarinimicrobiota bacterium]MBT3618043.1 cysteine desulfurase [Candidatus Neomarinimicrobiota bacterium]MBT3828500.1 cysteine desulfurase [Candidatus Neomarinimicrobiota bacterium]MBT3998029.1 cysteine desulfurase [Candidatus Neomarinimicrobiota bacterium]MBT4280267.1 cysteine desulfurase [Candidatus Neomarinimicrobiota bacterium]